MPGLAIVDRRPKMKPRQTYNADQFRIAPTCPPSTGFWMKGGIMFGGPDNSYNLRGHTWWVDSILADFSPSTGAAVSWTYDFTNAYYYTPVCVTLSTGGGQAARLGTEVTFNVYPGATVEYATSTAAENAAWNLIGPNGEEVYYAEYPLAIIILRNNGLLAPDAYASGQLYPIDAVNRGRSYIWWDARPPSNMVVNA